MKKNPLDEAKIFRHPSYGAITIGRVSSGSPHAMYGSSVKHRDTIRMTIHHGECKRMLNGDWYSPREQIVEVEMTQNQWAELVSSIGMGAGVPCTIKWLNGPVEECPFTSKVEVFQDEFRSDLKTAMEDVETLLQQAQDLLEKKTVTKSDKTELLETIRSLKQAYTSTLPFVSQRFVEQMEKTATEVKGELEAWQLNKLQQFAALGMAAANGEASPIEMSEMVPSISDAVSPDGDLVPYEDQAAAKAALQVGQEIVFRDLEIGAPNLDIGTVVALTEDSVDIRFSPDTGHPSFPEETLRYGLDTFELYHKKQ